jgi:hypothetical protein
VGETSLSSARSTQLQQSRPNPRTYLLRTVREKIQRERAVALRGCAIRPEWVAAGRAGLSWAIAAILGGRNSGRGLGSV